MLDILFFYISFYLNTYNWSDSFKMKKVVYKRWIEKSMGIKEKPIHPSSKV